MWTQEYLQCILDWEVLSQASMYHKIYYQRFLESDSFSQWWRSGFNHWFVFINKSLIHCLNTWPDKQKLAGLIIFRYISVIFQLRNFKFGLNVKCYEIVFFFNMCMSLRWLGSDLVRWKIFIFLHLSHFRGYTVNLFLIKALPNKSQYIMHILKNCFLP